MHILPEALPEFVSPLKRLSPLHQHVHSPEVGAALRLHLCYTYCRRLHLQLDPGCLRPWRQQAVLEVWGALTARLAVGSAQPFFPCDLEEPVSLSLSAPLTCPRLCRAVYPTPLNPADPEVPNRPPWTLSCARPAFPPGVASALLSPARATRLSFLSCGPRRAADLPFSLVPQTGLSSDLRSWSGPPSSTKVGRAPLRRAGVFQSGKGWHWSLPRARLQWPALKMVAFGAGMPACNIPGNFKN